MLAGRLTIDAHLEDLAPEFPEDCRRLVPAIRSRPPLAARAVVERHLAPRSSTER